MRTSFAQIYIAVIETSRLVLKSIWRLEMANGRNLKSKKDGNRDGIGFVALPWVVLDCAAFIRLSHPAKSLLIEISRQFVGNNNGSLLASYRYLRTRGWTSADTITRAKKELLAAGLIHETVKGHRPNKASWYAVTWRGLDKLKGYDFGVENSFDRGGYQKNNILKPHSGQGSKQIRPRNGKQGAHIAPSSGAVMTLN
jgi:hypothetical protein